SCGIEREVLSNNLLKGVSTSCGCNRTKHAESKTKLYKVWAGMLQRCTNPNASNYGKYGGKGITVCNIWQKSYVTFKKWALANGYEEGLTLDRVKNNKGYSPKNCRWATSALQARNQGIKENNSTGVTGVSFTTTRAGLSYY